MIANNWSIFKILNKNPTNKLPTFELVSVANHMQEALKSEFDGDWRTRVESYVKQIDKVLGKRAEVESCTIPSLF